MSDAGNKTVLNDKIIWLKWFYIISILCFIVGIILPTITITNFLFIESTYSVLSGIFALLEHNEMLLFGLVFGFSIVVPIIKYLLLFIFLFDKQNVSESSFNYRLFKWIHNLGRWAMLDVFIVAVLFVAIKLNLYSKMTVHPGLYIFVISLLLNMIITQILDGVIKRRPEDTIG